MASASGHQHDEKVAATISSSSAATIHGEFLLHLLRKGSNINNQTKEEVFSDNIKNNNKPFAAPSSSSSSVAESWQLKDPAVAALGPSHTFENYKPKPIAMPSPNLPLQNPNVWLHSHANNKDQPLPFDQLPGAPYLNPYPFQMPPQFSAVTGTGAEAAQGLFYGPGGNAHGHLGIPSHSSSWMRSGVEGRSYPYGHTGGSEGGSIHVGDAWQPQKHEVDLQGLSKSSRGGLGFPLGGFEELRANDVLNYNETCVGGNHSSGNLYQNCVQGNSSAHRLDQNRNCISRNDCSSSHPSPVPGQALLPVAQEQLIRDGNLQFGSVTWHSEHGKHNHMNGMNDIHLHDRNKFELNSRDIFFNNDELPHNLQGKNGVVRFLCRPSSNQPGCVNPTVLGKGSTWEGSKAQDVEPRVSKGSVRSLDQRILKGKAEVVSGRRNTVQKETPPFAVNSSSHRDHWKKKSQVQASLEIGRDSNLNSDHHNGRGHLDLIRKNGIRNGEAQSGTTNTRCIMEPTKELVQIRTSGEDMENHSSQSGDGDVFKKCRGNQQEWRVKQSRIDGLMQSHHLDSFSTITDYLSALDVNRYDSSTFNDVLEKHLPNRICRPDDDSSCSHPLPSHLENMGPSSVQAMENEQYHKKLVEGAISEGTERFGVERRRQVKQREDLAQCKSEEAQKEASGAVYRANPAQLRPVGERDRYHNRNSSALSRVYKDLDSNTRQGMLMCKQNRHQLMKIRQKEFHYRVDLEEFTPGFLSLYESLIPHEEEETNRKQLISSLEKLINREWPGARLHLFGSCANAFAVSKSDIDVCLSIDYEPFSKAELVLRLAEILQAEDMQNVQALTHARVPIVKFFDPVTDISCDICINNILAVVNTKLLHDYAQIDVRLQQLAFMVKHWAKCRRINETYQGTLSSYAYVLLCIHFLQQRKPAILPCLQEMKATYQITIGEIICAYYDEVNELKHYGAGNKETLGQLLSAFFNYWAFRHDYANSVISVRTGGLLSKNEKDWTRRIGNERHLICIEDPFEISHDLGRVVDKHSIRLLKEEFQRAAEIMLYDPDPCVTLFKPYMPS